jgi:hypothetical protein
VWLAARPGRRRCYHCGGLAERRVACAPDCDVEFCSDTCRSAAVRCYHGPLCGIRAADAAVSAVQGSSPWDELSIALVWKMLGHCLASSPAGGPLNAPPPADMPPFCYLQRRPRRERDGAALAVWSAFRDAIGPRAAAHPALATGPRWVADALGVLSTNAAAVSTAQGDEILGLTPRASMFNHDCDANAWARWGRVPAPRGGTPRVTVIAARNIPAGAEVTMPYIDARLGILERQEALMAQFGFECRCARCEREAAACSGEDARALAALRARYAQQQQQHYNNCVEDL